MRVLLPRAGAGQEPPQVPAWTDWFFHDDTPGGAGFPGLARGIRRGYRSADVNVNACRAGRVLRLLLGLVGVLINTHWITTGHDHWTSRRVRGNVALRRLTWPVVRALRAPDGSRIRRLNAVIRRAAQLGYTHLELELKDGVDWLPFDQLVALIRSAERTAARAGIEVYWKTLSDIGNPLRRLRAVHEAGGVTVLLPRPHADVLPAADYWPVTDYLRGRVKWS